jgi:hypothetical protein
MGWYIVAALIAAALVLGWRLDRKDHRALGKSRRASDMTREALRYRERFRRGARR